MSGLPAARSAKRCAAAWESALVAWLGRLPSSVRVVAAAGLVGEWSEMKLVATGAFRERS